MKPTSNTMGRVHARSMEIGGLYFENKWQLRTHPVGSPDNFSVKKGFVSIDANYFLNDTKIDHITEGMNEDGLSISSLTHMGA